MNQILKNHFYDVNITGYTSEGAGVARLFDRAVFIKHALIGEQWRIKIIKVTKSVVYGLAVTLLSDPSPERVLPECPYFPKCGGCDLWHMTYAEELLFKQNRVNDALQRIANLSFTVDEIIGSDSIYAYRNKGIFAVQQQNDQVCTGFYRPRSHDLIPVDRCLIQTPLTCHVIKLTQDWMQQYDISAYDEMSGTGTIRHIYTRQSMHNNSLQLCLVANQHPRHLDLLIESLTHACHELTSIILCLNTSTGNTVLTEHVHTLWGTDELTESLCGLQFKISPLAFFQINPPQAERLYHIACAYAIQSPDDTILDLFCGAGTITLCLAQKARYVIGVEIIAAAIENAKVNAKNNEIQNVEFLCADAGEAAQILVQRQQALDCVVVDPPRKGLDDLVISSIIKMNPHRIVYVSCDPGTLARDLKKFAIQGYEIKKACAVDMFPRTRHVETVVLMSRVDK